MTTLSPFEAAWKKRFEAFAELNTDAEIAGWSETGLQSRIRFFLYYFHPQLAGKWLDVGCGAGTYSQILQQAGLDVVAVDYSVPSLLKAKQRYDNKIVWGAANIYQLPFRQGAFDGLICFGVLQALSNTTEALEELHKMLNYQGEIWIDGLNRWCIAHWLTLFKSYLKGRSHLLYLSPHAIQIANKQKSVYWLPILPSSLKRLQAFFYYPLILNLWQHMGWVTRFFSHSFLIRIR